MFSFYEYCFIIIHYVEDKGDSSTHGKYKKVLIIIDLLGELCSIMVYENAFQSILYNKCKKMVHYTEIFILTISENS